MHCNGGASGGQRGVDRIVMVVTGSERGVDRIVMVLSSQRLFAKRGVL